MAAGNPLSKFIKIKSVDHRGDNSSRVSGRLDRNFYSAEHKGELGAAFIRKTRDLCACETRDVRSRTFAKLIITRPSDVSFIVPARAPCVLWFLTSWWRMVIWNVWNNEVISNWRACIHPYSGYGLSRIRANYPKCYCAITSEWSVLKRTVALIILPFVPRREENAIVATK